MHLLFFGLMIEVLIFLDLHSQKGNRGLAFRCSVGGRSVQQRFGYPSRVLRVQPVGLVPQFRECCNIAVISRRALSPCFHCSGFGAEPFCRCW